MRFDDLDAANEEVRRLRAREQFYCPLSRELNVENARLRALAGEHREEDHGMLVEEALQLHREREWAVECYAAAAGITLSDARVLMRRRFGSPEARAAPLSMAAAEL